MKRIETRLPDVFLYEPRRFGDIRGYFFESWNQERYASMGLPVRFVQDNISFSPRNVLRGLHYQYPHSQGKLVSVLHGEVYDVVVDLRRGSPTFGQWVAQVLTSENGLQIYIPEGFAHGFVACSETALFHYKCTEYYHPESEHTIRWDDPVLAIDWPTTTPILSEKDKHGKYLSEIDEDELPVYSSDDGDEPT